MNNNIINHTNSQDIKCLLFDLIDDLSREGNYKVMGLGLAANNLQADRNK
jgi:hypothetical protein